MLRSVKASLRYKATQPFADKFGEKREPETWASTVTLSS